MNYEHKGVKIELLASGEFSATVEGKFLVKPSLAAMKKVIDSGVKDKLAYNPPLVMLALTPLGTGSMKVHECPVEKFRVKVTRLAPFRGKYRNSGFMYETDERGGQIVLAEDTPENYEQIIAWLRAQYEAQQASIEWGKKIEAERAKIVMKGANKAAEEKGL